MTKDKEVLEILLSANVAKGKFLGMDFGAGGGIAPDVDHDLENECNPKELQNRSEKKQMVKDGIDFKVNKNKEDAGMFEEEQVGEGDQFMAVKPWLGVVTHSVPTGYKPSKRDGESHATLQLEYIYGYRCHDARNNLRYTASGQIVYHAAAVGILHNPTSNT